PPMAPPITKRGTRRRLPYPHTPDLGRRAHVYIVDCESEFLDVMAVLLEDPREDPRVQRALEQMGPNAVVTLDTLRGARPDPVILEVVPCRQDAATPLVLLEQDPALCHLPILPASTSPGVAEQLVDAHDALVQDVLPKPFARAAHTGGQHPGIH